MPLLKITGVTIFAAFLQGGVDLRFDVFSVWNFVASALVLAGGGYLILRANRAAYVKVLKETSEGWERAYKQKSAELDDVRHRLERLQGQFDNQEKQHRDAIHQMRGQNQEIVALNIKLQIELKDKETEIAKLSTKVLYLETEVKELKRKYGELS
jgi:septal ring factor EnvC (AmiA/AmiB activator)